MAQHLDKIFTQWNGRKTRLAGLPALTCGKRCNPLGKVLHVETQSRINAGALVRHIDDIHRHPGRQDENGARRKRLFPITEPDILLAVKHDADHRAVELERRHPFPVKTAIGKKLAAIRMHADFGPALHHRPQPLEQAAPEIGGNIKEAFADHQVHGPTIARPPLRKTAQ